MARDELAQHEHKPIHELDLSMPDDLLDFVDQAWETGKARKQVMESCWALRIAHVLGFQWLQLDTNGQNTSWSGIDPMTDEDDEATSARITVNMLMGYVQDTVSKWSDGRIGWTSIPATDTSDDQDRATHHDRLCRFLWRHLDMASKWNSALHWVALCHNAFLQCGWDPESGSEIAVEPEDYLPADEAQGQDTDRVAAMLQQFQLGEGAAHLFDRRTGASKVFEGDNYAAVVSPFEIIPDPHTTCGLRGCQWVLRSRRRTLTYLLERYPNKEGEIEGVVGGQDGEYEVYPDQWLTRSALGLGEDDDDEATPAETAIVHELWHRPTSKYRDGIHAVVCQGEILHWGRNPYRSLPFVHFKEFDVPGMFWASGNLTQAIPIQEAINAMYSSIIDVMARTGNPWYAIAKDGRFRTDLFTAMAGTVVPCRDPQRDIKEFLPKDIPPSWSNLIDSFLRSLQQIFGTFDVSQGKETNQATSGRAINLLQQANQQRMGSVIQNFQGGLQDFAKKQLTIAGQNWEQERQIWVEGEHGERVYHTVAGGDLLGPDAGHAGQFDFDIEVEIQTKPNIAALMEMVEFLTKAGFLDPEDEDDRRFVLGMLDFGGKRFSFDRHALDRSKASEENQMIATGQIQLVSPMPEVLPPMIEPRLLAYGDHDRSHLEEHLRFTTTKDYERAVQANPMVRAVLMHHVQETHMQMAHKAITPQMAIRRAIQEMIPTPNPGQPIGTAAGPGPGANGNGNRKQPRRPDRGPQPREQGADAPQGRGQQGRDNQRAQRATRVT